MNCCDNKHDEQNTKPKKKLGHLKHILMMILCCGAPILIISLLPLISTIIPGSEKAIRTITPFLCPVLMVGMIPMMLKDMKANKASEKNTETLQSTVNGTKEITQQSDSGSCH